MLCRNFTLKMFDPKNQIIVFQSTGYEAIVEHAHDFLEIVYILAGKGIHNIRGREALLREGDMFVITTNDSHTMIPELPAEEFRWINCIVSRELMEKYCGYIDPLKTVNFADNREITATFASLLKEYEEANPFFQEIMMGKILSLIHEFKRRLLMESAPSASAVKTRSSYIDMVVSYIHQNYQRKITLEEISRFTGVSVGYIEKIFREDRATSPIEYLNVYRVEMACKLLIFTNDTIMKISETIGFNDVKFFYTIFKRQTGMAPGVYRKQKRVEKQQRLKN